jgi:hypothetical protein
MYATGNSKDGVYHFDSLPIAAASVDFFSDTKTQPSQAMREAMAFAPVGDEQKMEDPTTAELEMRVAKMLRKEAAVFLPSGARVRACVYLIMLPLSKRYTSILSYCVAIVVAQSLCHSAVTTTRCLRSCLSRRHDVQRNRTARPLPPGR